MVTMTITTIRATGTIDTAIIRAIAIIGTTTTITTIIRVATTIVTTTITPTGTTIGAIGTEALI
jgi:hypothetical protein